MAQAAYTAKHGDEWVVLCTVSHNNGEDTAMKFATKHLISSLAAAALMGGTAAWAQDPEPVATPAPPPGAAQRSVLPGEAVPLPSTQQSGSTSYVTGGVPHEQIAAFKQSAHNYPLNLEIYERDGNRNEFTADVAVKLINKSGDVVLDATTAGPFLWANVPAGQYKLQATLNGKTIERHVAVNGSGSTRAIVVFPQGTDN